MSNEEEKKDSFAYTDVLINMSLVLRLVNIFSVSLFSRLTLDVYADLSMIRVHYSFNEF